MRRLVYAALLTFFAIAASAQPIPHRILDSLGMIRPVIKSDPEARYLRANQDFGLAEGIAMTKGGRIWHIWVGGEDDATSYMLLSWSDDDGRHWTDTRFVIDPHRDDSPYPVRSIAGNLFVDPDGRLWLYFDQSVTYYDNRSGIWIAHCDNPDDDNPVWSEPQYVGVGAALQQIIILKDGTWLMPASLWERRYCNAITLNYGLLNPVVDAYHELDSLRKTLIYASTDKGATWQLRGGVRIPQENLDEPNLVEMPDGRIWLTTRSMAGIQQCFSSDGGCTWTEPEPYQPHVTSRHFMLRLASGNLLLVRHGRLDERTPLRSRLIAYISEDEGTTWKGGLMLDARDNVSYPFGFQSPDGHIYICFDYERQVAGEIYMAKFTERDVLDGRIHDRGSRKPALIYKPALAPCMQRVLFPRPEFRPAIIYDIADAADDKDLVDRLWQMKRAGYGAFVLVGEGDMDRAKYICDSLGNAVGIGLQDTVKFASRPFIARYGDEDALNCERIDRATRGAYLRGFCKRRVLCPGRLARVKGDARVEAWKVGGRYLICVSSLKGSGSWSVGGEVQEVRLKRLFHCDRAELIDPVTGVRTAIRPGDALRLAPEIWIALPRK